MEEAEASNATSDGFWSSVPEIIDAVSRGGLLGAIGLFALLFVFAVILMQRQEKTIFKSIALLLVFVFFVFSVLAIMLATAENASASVRSSLISIGLINPEKYPELPNSEIVRLLQVELTEARCDPGETDGAFGAKTRSAVDRYNHIVGSNCSALLLPTQNGEGSAWRRSLSEAAHSASICEASICPRVPPSYLLTTDSFCLAYNPRPVEGETATWSGKCDAEEFADGYGTLSWFFQDGTSQRGWHTGTFDGGRMVDGTHFVRREVAIDKIGSFVDGFLQGQGRLCYIAAGTCLVGEFSSGRYIRNSGQLEFQNGARYYGGSRDGFPRGEGTMYFADNHRCSRAEGAWREGELVSGDRYC